MRCTQNAIKSARPEGSCKHPHDHDEQPQAGGLPCGPPSAPLHTERGVKCEVIGQHLNLPVTSLSPEEAEGHFGLLALFAAMDVPVSSAATRQRFGWQPVQPGLAT